VAGVAVTGFIGFTVFKELFSSDSPNGLFQKASKECMEHDRVSGHIWSLLATKDKYYVQSLES